MADLNNVFTKLSMLHLIGLCAIEIMALKREKYTMNQVPIYFG